jgi:hypothetical protein
MYVTVGTCRTSKSTVGGPGCDGSSQNSVSGWFNYMHISRCTAKKKKKQNFVFL